MIGRGGKYADQYEELPAWALAEKFDQTDFLENPETNISEFHKNLLRQTGPDEPKMEHEFARRNNYSEDRINVREHAARNSAVPYHPEVFLGLVEKDPRGTALDPNMRLMYDQSRFRGAYSRFYPDDDTSVPESGRNEQRAIADTRKGFYLLKNRMNIFDTSLVGRSGARPVHKTGQDIELVAVDGQPTDLNHSKMIHGGDKTTILSNYLPIGWYNTTDHKFPVATYGPVYKNLHSGDLDIRGLHKTQQDTDLVESQGTFIQKGLAATMKRLATEASQTETPNFQLSLAEKIRKFGPNVPTRESMVNKTQETQEMARNIIAKTLNRHAKSNSTLPNNFGSTETHSKDNSRQAKIISANLQKPGKNGMGSGISQDPENSTENFNNPGHIPTKKANSREARAESFVESAENSRAPGNRIVFSHERRTPAGIESQSNQESRQVRNYTFAKPKIPASQNSENEKSITKSRFDTAKTRASQKPKLAPRNAVPTNEQIIFGTKSRIIGRFPSAKKERMMTDRSMDEPLHF